MSVSLPSYALRAHTTLTGAPSSDLTAFWSITGVVALAAVAGVYEITVHFMG
ncbi:MAG: hypothetical protein QJR09_12930 [Micrococcus sp.]|nr:hypothetical protein [Micrococcus sp.]